MSNAFIWVVAVLVMAGIVVRPFRLPEAVWAVGGALLLVVSGFLTPLEAWRGVGRGLDVYLFLTGMMLLAETAREEKVFDWLAAMATQASKGSARRLFFLIYVVGVIVTTFLSNDATAVVLTPAVAAAIKTARAKHPLPYLLICAFIANAASFVLPISNPANLVIYGSHMPPLVKWVTRFALPSLVSIVLTYVALYLTQRKVMNEPLERDIDLPVLSAGGRLALGGIGFTTVVLLAVSAMDVQLGLPTLITGVVVSALVLAVRKKSPAIVIRGVSWSVLWLVAGLFVIVEGLTKTGLTGYLSRVVEQKAAADAGGTALGSGAVIALASNVVNNLPTGLIAGSALQGTRIPEIVRSAVLIGVDLGPNLSVTGSLATILWLVALRREGLQVTAWTFLKLGMVVMTVALLCALAALWV
jgi:arsenical pump membrane protein